MRLEFLYHWTLKQYRVAILKEGLRIMMPCLSGGAAFPWICLSPTPSCAWSLSGAHYQDSEGHWDLWQVRVIDQDELYFRPDWGPVIREVRVKNSIPADRVWWVGTRELEVHYDLP